MAVPVIDARIPSDCVRYLAAQEALWHPLQSRRVIDSPTAREDWPDNWGTSCLPWVESILPFSFELTLQYLLSPFLFLPRPLESDELLHCSVMFPLALLLFNSILFLLVLLDDLMQVVLAVQ